MKVEPFATYGKSGDECRSSKDVFTESDVDIHHNRYNGRPRDLQFIADSGSTKKIRNSSALQDEHPSLRQLPP